MLGLVLTAAITPAAPPVDPDPKHLTVPPADQARAAALVEKLGSPRFEDREKAQEDLSAMGRLAVPALAEALTKNASAEVRARCQALYPRARADDLQARLEVFVADEAGKFEHELPGWAEFRQITAGCGPAARAVFAEVVAHPLGRELVMTDLPPQDLGARIAVRRQELYTRRINTTGRAGQQLPPTAVEVLALMLAETRIPSRHIPRTSSSVLVYTTPNFASAVNGGGREARVYRTIAGKWAASRDEALLMVQALSVATTLELSEAADLGARMVKTVGVTAQNKALAAMAVAKSGNPKFLPALESAFKDEGVVNVFGAVAIAPVGAPAPPVAARSVQLRDIALAAAVLLTEQDPTEYGFVLANNPSRTARYNYGVWSLPADRRAAAFEKWAKWRSENPDFGQLR